ncbi:VOC family protein [Luteimonas sp. BDR2-5]|uniref:VOC family protein n=1 Tax=Proluteimonas luteida TaxID=2878685 RepID=UPI001E54C26B|nr:VOC family protein [Luteimonas sp. BDR2-5]MCD9028039.1 VOC family protein [Luteimonas sp. BDR2-5]
MRINPYLYFDGRCAEAFALYARVFGGTPTLLPSDAQPASADDAAPAPERILHAHLEARGQTLMGSDVPPGVALPPDPHAFVSVDVDSDAEAERIFAALADGAEIRAPIAESFFAHRFGMLVDRFGTGWMVLHAKAC